MDPGLARGARAGRGAVGTIRRRTAASPRPGGTGRGGSCARSCLFRPRGLYPTAGAGACALLFGRQYNSPRCPEACRTRPHPIIVSRQLQADERFPEQHAYFRAEIQGGRVDQATWLSHGSERGSASTQHRSYRANTGDGACAAGRLRGTGQHSVLRLGARESRAIAAKPRAD